MCVPRTSTQRGVWPTQTTRDRQIHFTDHARNARRKRTSKRREEREKQTDKNKNKNKNNKVRFLSFQTFGGRGSDEDERERRQELRLQSNTPAPRTQYPRTRTRTRRVHTFYLFFSPFVSPDLRAVFGLRSDQQISRSVRSRISGVIEQKERGRE